MVISSDTEGEIVQVPVPRRYLPAVIRALAQAMGADGAGGAVPEARAFAATGEPFSNFNLPANTGGGGLREQAWTTTELATLRQLVSNKPAALAMLQLTAARPGEAVSFKAVYETAGVSRESARAGLAGLTKLIRGKFNRNNWPTNFEWDGEAHYRMSAEVAAMWSQASG